MSTLWKPLSQEFALWRDLGLVLPVWWRDDDAIETTSQLDRLIDLAADFSVQIKLAVIPQYAEPSLAERVKDEPLILPAVHGWGHHNHAPEGVKKAEFGATRSIAACRSDLVSALDRMESLFGENLHRMFVPPWNRFNPALSETLSELGYRQLSTYLPRTKPFAALGLTQINTHFDPVNWRQDRSLVAEDKLVAHLCHLLQQRRTGVTDNAEPLGILTHHLMHDEAIWGFLPRLLTVLMSGPVRFVKE